MHECGSAYLFEISLRQNDKLADSDSCAERLKLVIFGLDNRVPDVTSRYPYDPSKDQIYVLGDVSRDMLFSVSHPSRIFEHPSRASAGDL